MKGCVGVNYKHKTIDIIVIGLSSIVIMFILWYFHNRPYEDPMWNVDQKDTYIKGYNYTGLNHPFDRYIIKYYQKTGNGLKLVNRKYYTYYKYVPKFKHHIEPKWWEYLHIAARSD